MNRMLPLQLSTPAAVLTRLLMVGVVASLSIGCSGSDPDQEIRTGEDGVREVVSTAETPPAPPCRVVEELVIGVEYGDEDYMLRRPLDFVVMGGGEIVVFDSNPLQLRVFDENGSYLTSFGQPGQGPGDLQSSGSLRTTLRATDASSLELWSGWPCRRQHWDIDGRLIAVHSLPDDHPFLESRSPGRFRPFGNRLLGVFSTYRRLDPGVTETAEHLVFTDWEGTYTDTLVTLTERLEMSQDAGMAQAVSDHTPREQYLLTTDGRVYYSAMTEDWIREYDPDSGNEVLRFRWIHEPDAIPQSMVEDYGRQFGKTIGDGAAWLRQNIYLLYLAEGPEGEIWVQRTGDSNEEGLWITDAFGRDGTFRGRMALPFPPRLHRLHGDQLYAIGWNGDAPALIRYRLEPAGR
jgi:hypothetical protein